MLHIKKISAGYSGFDVLKDITIEVGAGKTVVILGPNGVGKSTLLNTIVGLLRPTAGEIFFNDARIDGEHPYKIVEMGISIVPEGGKLFPGLTVFENLKIGSYSKKSRKHFSNNLEEVYDLFPRVKEREKQMACTMSGGERQMVAIARALMSKPKLLILDEPSSGLAPKVVSGIFEFIKKIKERGYSVLMVEQTINKAINVADYCYLLDSRRIKFHGTKDDFINNANIKNAYLGI